MLPNFANLSLDTRSSQRLSVTNDSAQSKGITKKKMTKPLPPGWVAYNNNAGDVQYTDGTLHTYTVAQAWDRYNRKQEEAKSTPYHEESHDIISCGRDEAYGSISKELHRTRIVDDMLQYVCATGHTPSLVYLGAPDGSDSQFFQRQVESHSALKGTRLVAVNLATIQRIDDTDKVEYITDTIENYMASVDDDTFSHAWLDTTSLEIDNQLLWNTKRSTVEKVYLVVSLKGNFGYRSKEDSVMILKTQCEFFGLSIKHQEAYCGITPNGAQSKKINMMFFTCKIENVKVLTVYDDNYNSIGAMIDVPIEIFSGSMGDVAIFESKNAYLGLIKGYDMVSGKWSVQFFDLLGNLIPGVYQFETSRYQKVSPFLRSYFNK